MLKDDKLWQRKRERNITTPIGMGIRNTAHIPSNWKDIRSISYRNELVILLPLESGHKKSLRL